MSSEAGAKSKSQSAMVIPGRDILPLVASVGLQLILGALFGHAYDIRIFMATGYLTSSGQDPYILPDLRAVFNNPDFIGMTSIGYPPPWPLILGVIYLLTYATTHNFLFYNLGIKLPSIIANIALAYLVRDILQDHNARPGVARAAWLFMLFNPFALYFTAAWGQFDTLLALLTLLALRLLSKQRLVVAAVLLALAISLKPTPVAVGLAAVAYLWKPPWTKLAKFGAAFAVSMLVFCILPFVIFKWDASPIYHGWNNQFTVSGGMSITTLYELVADTYVLPGRWWLLGVLWIPATIVGAIFLPRGERGFLALLKNSLSITLIFFLTRTWLSEQNLALILTMVLILAGTGELPWLAFHATWALPLIFTVFNTTPAQLLFPVDSNLMATLLRSAEVYRTQRLLARMLVVIPWWVTGWWMVARCYKTGRVKSA
jgi:hypothetical protein